MRDEASNELRKIGDRAIYALDKALAGNPSLETRRRLEALRSQTDPTSMILKGNRLRAYRAVEVLERIGTPEARRLLTSYANGAPGALLTTSAEAALKRYYSLNASTSPFKVRSPPTSAAMALTLRIVARASDFTIGTSVVPVATTIPTAFR